MVERRQGKFIVNFVRSSGSDLRLAMKDDLYRAAFGKRLGYQQTQPMKTDWYLNIAGTVFTCNIWSADT